MKLFIRCWFFDAMAFSSASASASVQAGGSVMALWRAMLRGTMESISDWRDFSPMTASIFCSSSGVMPMWRATNSLAFSRLAREGAWDMTGAPDKTMGKAHRCTRCASRSALSADQAAKAL